MPCKIDHTDPENVPAVLCRACHPELNRRAPLARREGEEPITPVITPEAALKYERKQRRRLRAEVKKYREQLETIGNRDPKAAAKVQAALDRAYADLALAS